MNGDAEFTEIIVGETVFMHEERAHIAELGRHVAPNVETFVSASMTGYAFPEEYPHLYDERGNRKAGT